MAAYGEPPAYWRKSTPYHAQDNVLRTRPRTSSLESQSSSSYSSRSSNELPQTPMTPSQPSPMVSVFEDDSDDERPIHRRLKRKLRRANSSLTKPENRFGFGNNPPARTNSTRRDGEPKAAFIMYTNGEEIHFIPEQPRAEERKGHNRKWSWSLAKPKEKPESTPHNLRHSRSSFLTGDQVHRHMEAVHRAQGF